MKSCLRIASILVLCSLFAACDSSTSDPAPAGNATPKGPGILGTWIVDTSLTFAGLPTEVNVDLIVTSDSLAVDTLERYNNDGGDVEDLYWVTRRTWSAVGNDVVFTKTTCRRTDFLGGWANISCLTPAKDTVIGGMNPGLTSFTLRARESSLGVLTFHKAK